MQKHYLASVSGAYYKYLGTLFFRAESSSSKKIYWSQKLQLQLQKNCLEPKAPAPAPKKTVWSQKLKLQLQKFSLEL